MTYEDHIKRLLTQPEIPGANYYSLSLLVDAEGRLSFSIQTQWCGYTEERPLREIREGALHYGEAQRDFYHEMGELALLVNSEEDLKFFYMFGGHGVIIEPVGKKHFNRLIEPHVVLRDSSGLGFRTESSVPSTQRQHAPSKKVRMEVLVRDGRRCLICGRSPAYYVDVELHVHHAIPWGQGGVTEPANLITLCKTCHDGLDPHYDRSLSVLLAEKYPRPNVKYVEGVKRYQRWLKEKSTRVDSKRTPDETK